MMTDKLDGTKILSIADKNYKAPEFIEKLEQERVSVKLYYYMWLSRLFIFFAVVSLVVFMSVSLSLFKLAPQVFVEPFMIINQDSSNNIVRAEAMTPDMASKDKILEIFMRQYVILRNTVIPDEVEMMSRWFPGGMVHFYSGDAVFDEFSGYAQGVFKSIIEGQYTRSVVIDNIGKVGGQKSPVWKVDFRTFDLTPGNVENETGAMKMTTRYWTASISAQFFNNRSFLGRRLINPLGFTVIRYSQAQVNVY